MGGIIMKRFSLEEYLKNPNRKIVTRDGRKVRIICTDFNNPDFPVIGEVEGYIWPSSFTKSGLFIKGYEEHLNDLFFAPEKHEGWVNVYKEFESNSNYMGRICNSEEEAKKKTDINGIYLATIKIEWEDRNESC